MDTVRKDCIWYEQCGSDCNGRCCDYSPLDEYEQNEKFYRLILDENAEEYNKMVQDYSGDDEL